MNHGFQNVCPAVTIDMVDKPRANGVLVDALDLHIGNHHVIIGFVADRFTRDDFQIAGEQQKTPDVVLIDINCAVGHVLKNLCVNRCAVDEFLYHRLGTLVGLLDKSLDNPIGTGVRPVRLTGNHVILQVGVNAIQNTPRVIDLRQSEPIAVIPFCDCSGILFQGKGLQNLFHFFLGKTEILGELVLRDEVSFQVVQACENTLSGYPQTACQNRKFQRGISFQGRLKAAANQVCHVIVEALVVGVF